MTPTSTAVLWLALALQDAQTPQPTQPGSRPVDDERPPITAVLDQLGLDVATTDGNYRLHVWFRGQFRYSYPFDKEPTTPDGFEQLRRSSLDVRRARLKVGGHAYRPWLDYYLEYDFVTPTLLDVRLTVTKIPWLQLRVGQWKVNYNRERVDSSGRQQFVERSIVNRVFTVDRQPGVSLRGHLFRGRLADSWYTVGMFNGNGVLTSNDDAAMMWMARYQWQFLRRPLAFTQSDVSFHEKPAGTLAVATVRNTSRYTRFSTDGGGQLDGFEDGVPGQYEVTQYLEEAAFKYRGFSFQHELHWKEIDDHVNQRTTKLRGTYAQAGYRPWARDPHTLSPLELAFRYAWVDDDTSRPDDDRREWTFGANWFFSGHDNKLTLDLSRLTLEQPDGQLGDVRVRAQWDISF